MAVFYCSFVNVIAVFRRIRVWSTLMELCQFYHNLYYGTTFPRVAILSICKNKLRFVKMKYYVNFRAVFSNQTNNDLPICYQLLLIIATITSQFINIYYGKKAAFHCSSRH